MGCGQSDGSTDPGSSVGPSTASTAGRAAVSGASAAGSTASRAGNAANAGASSVSTAGVGGTSAVAVGASAAGTVIAGAGAVSAAGSGVAGGSGVSSAAGAGSRGGVPVPGAAGSSAGAAGSAGATGGDFGFAATVQPLINQACNCHQSTPTLMAPFSLKVGEAYEQLVSVPAQQLPSMLRVKPGSLQDSYLWHKIEGTQAEVGGSGMIMPSNIPLNATEKLVFQRWIEAGAKP